LLVECAQENFEGRARAGHAAYTNPAAVRFYNPSDDGESEAAAGRLFDCLWHRKSIILERRTGGIDAVEAFEEMRKMREQRAPANGASFAY
jgi:hypothetical protein